MCNNFSQNPILSGFYPDPSICRVGQDFYLVNSTFAYFPGIPIHHSTDLIHWEFIGNVIDRPSQLSFANESISHGLYAPTIRFHNGTFYVLCTNVDNSGNFIVTAKQPTGPWTDPLFLPDAPGIDPSIFFDDDTGKIWYIGTRPAPEGCKYNGNWEVWIQELDSSILEKAGKTTQSPLKGPSYGIWRGALRNCIWPEGPHIYKKDGWYYLIAAEGGTAIDHAVMAARSQNITSDWIGKPSNPVLTHRYLGHNADIINAGHADLFDAPDGSWWMVLLASRQNNGCTILGRETFLVPVRWEDNWPFVATKTGLIEEKCLVPEFEQSTHNQSGNAIPKNGKITFSMPKDNQYKLPNELLSLRFPCDNEVSKTDIPIPAYSLSARPNFLRLFARQGTLQDTNPVSFVCRRIQHFSWTASAKIEFSPKNFYETAGFAIIQSEKYLYKIEISLDNEKEKQDSIENCGFFIKLIKTENGNSVTLAQQKVDRKLPSDSLNTGIILLISANNMNLDFGYSYDCDKNTATQKTILLYSGADASILDTAKTGSFTGIVTGVFASSNGKSDKNINDTGYVDISYFSYSDSSFCFKGI